MWIFLYLTLFLSINSALAKKIVNVGAYNFPPYIQIDNEQISGMTPEIIKLANEIQDEIEFKLFITTANRRYQDFKNGRFEVMFFEDLTWGWDKLGFRDMFESTDVFMTGGEIFISSKDNQKTQSYFKDIQKKTKMGILGYHYKFANFNSDPEYLRTKHNLTLSENQKSIINAIVTNHFQIGIVTKEYLNRFFKNNPEITDKIIVSNFLDQKYNHRIIYKKNSEAFKKGFIKNLLKKLKKSKKFKKIIKG